MVEGPSTTLSYRCIPSQSSRRRTEEPHTRMFGDEIEQVVVKRKEHGGALHPRRPWRGLGSNLAEWLGPDVDHRDASALNNLNIVELSDDDSKSSPGLCPPDSNPFESDLGRNAGRDLAIPFLPSVPELRPHSCPPSTCPGNVAHDRDDSAIHCTP